MAERYAFLRFNRNQLRKMQLQSIRLVFYCVLHVCAGIDDWILIILLLLKLVNLFGRLQLLLIHVLLYFDASLYNWMVRVCCTNSLSIYIYIYINLLYLFIPSGCSFVYSPSKYMHLFMKISSLLEDIIYFFTNHLSGWNSWAFLLIGFRSRVFVIYVTGHRILYIYI